jgi:chaperonin GroES
MDVRPLHDRIIVRRHEESEQNSGGIIIPDTAKEKPQRGTVIAAGSGTVRDGGTRVPLDLKAGDVILFGKYTSQEIKLDGEEYLIMREDEGSGGRRNRLRENETNSWLNRLCTAMPHGKGFFAGSTAWPTRSRSHSDREGGT